MYLSIDPFLYPYTNELITFDYYFMFPKKIEQQFARGRRLGGSKISFTVAVSLK